MTLTELLVVVGILALLAAIVTPVVLRAKASANQSACLSNLRQVGTAVTLYVTDADERTPAAPSRYLGGRVAFGTRWAGKVATYAKTLDVFRCRADGRELPVPI